MLFGLIRDKSPVIASGQRVELRHPQRADFNEWAKLRADSAEFLKPWEPSWTSDELSKTAFKARLRRADIELENGTGQVFFIFDQSSGTLVGGISLGNIRYGMARSGQIGYWMGEAYAGKGYMQDAVKALISFGFDRLNLHRLEAACIPSNERSVGVLRKTGFTQEGLLKSYLKINGKWQDHLLFAIISGLNE
jgi:[ribosomal protein S5]-alanine N-acetyltransferase